MSSSDFISPEQFQRLLEISTLLSSTLDLDKLLNIVIDLAIELTNTEAGAILLVEKDTGELHFAATSGDSSIPPDVVVPLEGSLAGWIVKNGQPLILNDVQKDGRHFTGVDTATNFMTSSMLGVPLIAKGKVIGALEALNKKSVNDYSPQDVKLLESLAAQAAVAIENARLFQQSDMIAEIMHELKTPLMSITAASDLLVRGILPADKSAQLTGMINQESLRLAKMTQDFLNLARLESGRTHMEVNLIDLNELITQVAMIQESQANQKEIKFILELPAESPPVLGDKNQMKQVLLNLSSNAIKYNFQNGRIILRLFTKENEVYIDIEDTGPGIAPDDLKNLFQRFYRVPDKEGFSEGTGLGLSIAQKIMEKHKGRINVRSKVNIGTTFTCILPLAKSETTT